MDDNDSIGSVSLKLTEALKGSPQRTQLSVEAAFAAGGLIPIVGAGCVAIQRPYQQHPSVVGAPWQRDDVTAVGIDRGAAQQAAVTGKRLHNHPGEHRTCLHTAPDLQLAGGRLMVGHPQAAIGVVPVACPGGGAVLEDEVVLSDQVDVVALVRAGGCADHLQLAIRLQAHRGIPAAGARHGPAAIDDPQQAIVVVPVAALTGGPILEGERPLAQGEDMQAAIAIGGALHHQHLPPFRDQHRGVQPRSSLHGPAELIEAVGIGLNDEARVHGVDHEGPEGVRVRKRHAGPIAVVDRHQAPVSLALHPHEAIAVAHRRTHVQLQLQGFALAHRQQADLHLQLGIGHRARPGWPLGQAGGLHYQVGEVCLLARFQPQPQGAVGGVRRDRRRQGGKGGALGLPLGIEHREHQAGAGFQLHRQPTAVAQAAAVIRSPAAQATQPMHAAVALHQIHQQDSGAGSLPRLHLQRDPPVPSAGQAGLLTSAQEFQPLVCRQRSAERLNQEARTSRRHPAGHRVQLVELVIERVKVAVAEAPVEGRAGEAAKLLAVGKGHAPARSVIDRNPVAIRTRLHPQEAVLAGTAVAVLPVQLQLVAGLQRQHRQAGLPLGSRGR